MKKIFIVLTFVFISLVSFADNTNVGVRIPLGEQKVELDPSVKMLMGLTKVENDPKYKKLVDYVEENLAKKGIVKYYGAINLKKGAMEVFSENGTLLDEEKLPDEFMAMVSLPLNFEEGKEKEKVKKMLKEAYENPTYVTISKNNGKPKIYMERTMGHAEEKIKMIDEVTLKRELTEAEKTETAVIYDKDNNSMKMEIKYKDNSLKNGTARSYTNNKLVQEMVFENSTAILIREYHDNGNLATELPANGEAKIYYENGKIKESVPVKNGNREGIGREYDETGKVIKETLYRNDKEIKKAKKLK